MDSPWFQLRTSESCENILELKWAKSLKDKAANFKRNMQVNTKVFQRDAVGRVPIFISQVHRLWKYNCEALSFFRWRIDAL